MTPSIGNPAPHVTTAPDQISKEALEELSLLEDERIHRVWKTGAGFLVMTNLRCVEVWRKPKILGKRDWETGPNFFFYNLAPPKVLFGRFLRLAEEWEKNPQSVRFVVHDPHTVAEEIQAARSEGRAEWLRRRSNAEARLRHEKASRPSNPFVIREVIREVIKVRCGFCGNLMDATCSICPSCGAPQR